MHDVSTIGWREWLALPDLGIGRIKAKVDTGARSSSLHAFEVEVTGEGKHPWVHFKVHPIQRDSVTIVQCRARLYEYRYVKSSSGHRELRPIIRTRLLLEGGTWPIELTLTSRDEMGFRMLLGREAIRGRFVVDPNRSYRCRGLVPRRHKKRKKARP
ncbi:MAG: RimK/LysX family protein [Polyangiales bacterium]